MSVTKEYSVKAINSPIKVRTLKGELDLSYSFILSSYLDGDASGGQLAFYYDLKELGMDYFCISDYFAMQNTQAVQNKLNVWSSQFENFFFNNVTIWQVPLASSETLGANIGNPARDNLNGSFIYLGKPISDSNPSQISHVFYPNNNGERYWSHIFGFALNKALPMPGASRMLLF